MLAAAGAHVLTGSCLPFADAVPYAPFAQILGHLSAVTAPTVRVPSAADPADRFRFFAWVADQLVAAASAQPLVVVVEDLHWADESTGDLLLFVANAARSAPVLVVASRRPSEGNRADGLSVALGELVRSGRAVQVGLGPLGPEEVGELIGRIIGSEPAPGLLDRIADRADGNPFFVEELVAAGGGADLPTTIADVVLQRVASVDPSTQQLLRVAARHRPPGQLLPVARRRRPRRHDDRRRPPRGDESPVDGAVRRAVLVPPRPRPPSGVRRPVARRTTPPCTSASQSPSPPIPSWRSVRTRR